MNNLSMYKNRLLTYIKVYKDYYYDLGYNFILDKNNIVIYFKNSKYDLKVQEKKNKIYLFLSPYNKPYFEIEVNIDEILNKLNMVLFAIEENEKLYKNGN